MLLRLTIDEFEWDDWNGEANLECSSQTRIESQLRELAIPGAFSASVQPPMDLRGNPAPVVYVNVRIAVFD